VTIKRILLTLVLVLVGTNAFAASHYIRAGASGANNGADWTNAWTSFSQVSWTRGDVYYIAAGSYGAVHLTKADSGTSVIELRGAIGGTGDHGTSTGWDDSFQGQALLSGGGSNILTNYWTINGQAVPGCTYPTNNEACYTIKIVNPANGNRPTSDNVLDLCGGGGAPNCTNYVLKYIDFLGTNTEGTNFTDEGIHCYPQCSNTTISHSYIHHVGCDLLAFNSFDSSPFLLEYNWIAYDDVGLGQISGGPAHCQGIEITAATITLRYNVWQDMQSSGAITDAAGGNAPIAEWDIYGNIFFWDAAWTAKFTGNGAVGYDDGIVGLFSLSNSNGILKFFNNTITSPGLAESQNCNAWAYYVTQLGVVATVYNNIWYGFDSSKCHAGASGPGTYDYNAYFSVSGGKQDNGSHSFSSNKNPFVNPSASTIAGFMLTADTQPGVQLGAPFNVDMLGTSRGASGIWDMGALQLSGTSASLPPVPQNLHVTSIK
jgi:hypothetical protein